MLMLEHDNCHFTGKYQGAAHSKCNLKDIEFLLKYHSCFLINRIMSFILRLTNIFDTSDF